MSQAARRPSLLERAAEIYDFSSGALIAPAPVVEPVAAPAPAQPEAPAVQPLPAAAEPDTLREPKAPREEPAPQPRPLARAPRLSPSRGAVAIDRQRLREAGLLVPEDPSNALAEELRLVKRQLLAGVGRAGTPDPKGRSALICSAQANEGKTFCALNLALSLAGEQDVEVLLVDGDVAKPAVFRQLGLEPGPGLVDALADPAIDAESLVVRTDVDGLSLLSSGRQANNVPELIASERTRHLLDALAAADPRRIILFDSPPVLMASSAGALAAHVGQVLVVVRADVTTEADLKETIALLAGNNHLALVLNGAGFAAGGRRYGQYYGVEP